MSVATLLASPLTEGLFRRAIIQSGHGSMVRPLPVASRLTRRLARILGIPPGLDGFRSCSPQQCIDAVNKVSKPGLFGIDLRDDSGREPAFGLSRFLPIYGDDVLPEIPLAAMRGGRGAGVELLIGSNREEMNLYMVPTGAGRKLNTLLAWVLLARVQPNALAILRVYGLARRKQSAGQVFTNAMTDLVFRLPTRAFAAAHRGRTHFYEFGWRSPLFNGQLGACHAIELPSYSTRWRRARDRKAWRERSQEKATVANLFYKLTSTIDLSAGLRYDVQRLTATNAANPNGLVSGAVFGFGLAPTLVTLGRAQLGGEKHLNVALAYTGMATSSLALIALASRSNFATPWIHSCPPEVMP